MCECVFAVRGAWCVVRGVCVLAASCRLSTVHGLCKGSKCSWMRRGVTWQEIMIKLSVGKRAGSLGSAAGTKRFQLQLKNS